LSSPVTLLANTTYYLVTQEVAGGDQWYEYGPVTATPGAGVIVSPAYRDSGGSYRLLNVAGASYVPPNLLFQ
jgi:hypothetical protein